MSVLLAILGLLLQLVLVVLLLPLLAFIAWLVWDCTAGPSARLAAARHSQGVHGR